MRKLFACIAALAAVHSTGGTANAGPFDSWTHYRDVIVNTTGTGANVTGTVSNFPVLVRLSGVSAATGANVLSGALAGGADIRFTDSTGTTSLAYEIEHWDTAAAAIWVKIPSVAGGANTKIRLYWGKAAQASLSNGAAVFDTTNGFRAVFHLNEANDSTARDATGLGFLATPGNFGGATNPADTTGAIGKAKNFRGVGGTTASARGSYYILNGSAASRLNFVTNADQYTLSAWIRVDSVPGTGTVGRTGIIAKYGSTANQQYQMGLFGNAAGTATCATAHKTLAGGGGGYREVTGAQGCAINPAAGWVFVTAVRSGVAQTNTAFYLNGVALTGTTGAEASATFSTTSNVTIGAFSDITRFFRGAIDEVRIDSTARDADWVKMNYETQKPGATAVTLGTTQVNATVPGAPTGVAGVAANAQVTVSWLAPASDGGSAITAYTATAVEDTSRHCTTPDGATLNCVIASLANGTAYTFTVTATNAVGTGAASAASSAVTPRTLPGAPTGIAGVGGNTEVTVSWIAPASNGGTAITAYTVTAVEDTSRHCGWTTGTLACVVTGLANGTAYTFTVTATNAVGVSAASAASSAVTPSPATVAPGAPIAAIGVAGNTQVAVSWTAPASNGGATITAYTVTAVEDTSKHCGWTTGALTCNVTGLTNGTAYTFTVTATNSVGTSPASAPSVAVTPAAAPGAPTAVVGAAGNAQVAVSWTAPVSNGGAVITAYTVTAVGDTSKHCGWTTGALTCNVTGLTNGTAYTFTVTAANVAGASAASAASAAVTPRTVPGAPTGVTGVAGAPGSGQVAVSWIAPASNGGAVITAYTVTAAPGGATCGWTTGALTCNVTGLTNGTAYTFTATATNVAGVSAASTASAPVVPPVGIAGAHVFRVTGAEKPYAFEVPASALASTEKVALSIHDAYGRTVWSKSFSPTAAERAIAWNGRAANGLKASAGMYVLRIAVVSGDKTATVSEQTLTLKPGR